GGAQGQVLKFFNKQVTHVVFKDGHQSVWKKAKKTGVKLVSVLWVERCLATGSHVDESLFPAINESVSLPGIKSKYRCMRPKDFLEKTPENDKRLRKKLDQMIQTQLPMLSFDEDDADVQSPKLKQYSLDHLFGMAERLKQMKEKRENLSPTGNFLYSIYKKLFVAQYLHVFLNRKQMIIIQILGQLGGFLFSDVVCETTTHVVAGQPCRTINILLGIARGCWILSFDWILWSLEHGCWVPEEQYELSDKFPAAAICRLEKQLSGGQYQHNLFVNQPLIFISPRSDPPASKLKELVLLCGGKVCKALRQAGMCIGEYRGRRYPGSPYLSEKWILDEHHCVLLPKNVFQTHLQTEY
uniref:Microcephalin 1 n=1 Tax=Callorhinchus milii TaxID=7868 RepID=A0A4W3K4Y5_CALMI